MTRKLFISYSHADADLLGELRVHLRPHERNGVIEPWYDGYLIPGDDFDAEVRKALAQSNFIALLVTPRFLASDYCVDVEMEDAVRRHLTGEARVVPIIAKTCGWKETFLKKLLATPKDGMPITKWRDQDEAWDMVAGDLARAARNPLGQKTVGPELSTHRDPAAPDPRAMPAQPQRTTVAAQIFSIPRNAKPTDQQLDDFRHEAFERIAELFEASVSALTDGMSGRFRRVDANRFTATLYRQGQKLGGCTVFTGTGHFAARGIAYSGTDSGETNGMNEELSVDLGPAGLGLKPLMRGVLSGERDKTLSPEESAKLLWDLFTERLRY